MEIPLCPSSERKILLEILLVGINEFYGLKMCFWLSWLQFRRKFQVKRAKYGHFCIQPNTPTPRRRSPRLGVEVRLGVGLRLGGDTFS